MAQMTAARLLELADEAGLEWREGYSGRGMYGKECPAIVSAEPHIVGMKLMLAAELHEQDALVDAFEDARTDEMGRTKTILYFPRLATERAA